MRTTTFALTTAAAVAVSSAALAADGYMLFPAISGNRLVFASEGDLWTATLPQDASATIEAYRLTNGAGIESHPVISPDGTRVAFDAEYEGNRDVYVMPLDGGAPTRLTYHPDVDVPLAWTPDGTRIAFRSPRENGLGRQELWYVPAEGGPAVKGTFGECGQISFDPAGGGERFAFSPWTNDHWHWKRYRGGTAPEVWYGDTSAREFRNLSANRAQDRAPMWIGDRIWFASDRDGAMNLWSFRADGSDLTQHTHFASDPNQPTAPEGYEMRFPSADATGAPRIAFAQGGGIGLFDAADGSVRRLPISLVSDRAGTRPRFVDATASASAFTLSPKGDRVLLESRGELASLPVGKPKAKKQVGARQVTHDARSREWGATWLNDDEIVCVTDAGGEQQLAVVLADGSAAPRLLTQDRNQWLLRPVASPDGRFVAFGDKDLRLWLLDVASRGLTEVDRSEAGEITDYAFSPDGTWLAWAKPMPNGMRWVAMRSTNDGTRVDLSDGLANDREPRFDPKGAYLYFLSDRHINPLIAGPDFEYVLPSMTEIFAVPLRAETPPPIPALAAAAGFDLKAWAEPKEDEKDDAAAEGEKKGEAKEPAKEGADDAADEPIVVEAAGLGARAFRLPIEAGNYRSLVPTFGGVHVIADPTRGIADAEWPAPPLGEPIGTLKRFTALDGETKDVVSGIANVAAARNGAAVAWLKDGAFHVQRGGEEKTEDASASGVQIRTDPPAEWAQMLDETWRLQRDFYWAPNMAGVDWDAMRARYAALLPKLGTRTEAADLMGQLISELGTSHTYIMGGEEWDRPKPLSVGLLGADLVADGSVVRIGSILPGQPWSEDLVSPLALAHQAVQPGAVLLSIDGRAVRPDRDPYELLLGKAGKTVVLEIADDAQGNNRRTVEITALRNERPLRYAAWVEANRRAVDAASGGRLGYLHIPDMDTEGLVMFSRLFYPQLLKDGLVVDIRDNGGGYVSQLILQRLARKIWAYQMPRQGEPETYPARTPRGPWVVLIDQNAGSDGDIFPESVRINQLAPLIGTRTWGGVVGIRADKPYLDGGVSTQPEFAWLDPHKSGVAAWSVENDGVPPDIEVPITPLDRMNGVDPQLAKGIEVLLERVKSNPPVSPPTPPFPDRSRARNP